MSTRARRKFKAGDRIIEIEEAPPRTAFLAIMRTMTILGPALSGLIAGTGIELGDGRKVSWQAIIQGGGAIDVVNALLKRIGGIDPEEVATLLDDLTVGRTWIHVPGAAAPIHVTSSAILDEFMPSGYAMIGLLRFAIEVNLRPILPATGTSDGSSAGSTSPSPAGT